MSEASEIRVVPTQPDSLLVKAFVALGQLPREYPQWVLAGGAAVLIQTAGSHRSTQDLDLLTDASERAISMLIDRHGERTTNGATLDGITIDILDISEGDTESGSYLAHRYAFDLPDQLTVILRNSSEEFVRLDLAVASVSSLIAMKAHAALDRRSTKPEKRATDTWDLLELTNLFAGELALNLPLLTSTLRLSTVERLEVLFGTDLTRSMSLLRGFGGPEAQLLEREHLVEAKESLIGWITSRQG
jgi:Nucleotidyl transferase AbiEii toxin, Type IV TA system